MTPSSEEGASTNDWILKNTVKCALGRVTEKSCASMRARPSLREARLDEAVRPIACESCGGVDTIPTALSAPGRVCEATVCERCGRTKKLYTRRMCETCYRGQRDEAAVKEARDAARDVAGERLTRAVRSVLGEDVSELSSKDLGKYVRAIRMAAGLDPAEFGEAVGLSRGSISRIECGGSGTSPARLAQIVDCFRPIASKIFRGELLASPVRATGKKEEIRPPRNNSENAEVLVGWMAIARFAGISERTLRDRSGELYECECVFLAKAGLGKKRVCAWTTDLAEWLEKENGGRRPRVNCLRAETIRDPLNGAGGRGELKVGWKEIARFAALSPRRLRGLGDELFAGGYVFYGTSSMGRRVCAWTSDLRDWMRQRQGQAIRYRAASVDHESMGE